MRAPNGRRRQVVMGLGIAAAAAACVPATADAAALIAAYDRFESSKGFDIGLVNVNTGAALPVPAAVNTTDDELHPTLTPDGRYLVFMRTKLQPKLNGDIVPPATRSLHRLDRQTGTLTALNVGAGSGPGFGAGGAILAWGIRPVLNGAQRTDVSQRASFSNGSLSTTISNIGSPPTTPSGQVLETPHAAVAKMTQSNTPVTARYLSFALLDANSGALQTGVAHLTTKFDAGPVTNGSSNSYGAAGTPASHPVPRSGDNYTALDLATTRRSTSPTAATSTSRPCPGRPRRRSLRRRPRSTPPTPSGCPPGRPTASSSASCARRAPGAT